MVDMGRTAWRQRMGKHIRRMIWLLIGVLNLMACQPAAAPGAVSTLPALTENPPNQTIIPTGELPAATPGDAMVSLLDLPYTEEDPLTDSDEILRILDELQQREVVWFSRPGWYRYTIHLPSGRDYTRTRYVLTHVINENCDCLEQFTYYEQDGIILPVSILLDDGSFGSITHWIDGTFQVSNALSPEESLLCDLGKRHSVGPETIDDFILHNEAGQFKRTSSAIIEGQQTNFQAWVEDVNGERTLVLVYDIIIEDPALRGGVLDPTTGLLSPAARNLRFYYIDLETGLQFQFNEEFYLESGKLVGNDDVDLLYTYEYLDTMPDPVKDSFEDVAEELRALLDETEDGNP